MAVVNLTGKPITVVLADEQRTLLHIEAHGIYRAHKEYSLLDFGDGREVFSRCFSMKGSIEWYKECTLLGATVIVPIEHLQTAKLQLRQCRDIMAPKEVDPGTGAITHFDNMWRGNMPWY